MGDVKEEREDVEIIEAFNSGGDSEERKEVPKHVLFNTLPENASEDIILKLYPYRVKVWPWNETFSLVRFNTYLLSTYNISAAHIKPFQYYATLYFQDEASMLAIASSLNKKFYNNRCLRTEAISSTQGNQNNGERDTNKKMKMDSDNVALENEIASKLLPLRDLLIGEQKKLLFKMAEDISENLYSTILEKKQVGSSAEWLDKAKAANEGHLFKISPTASGRNCAGFCNYTAVYFDKDRNGKAFAGFSAGPESERKILSVDYSVKLIHIHPSIKKLAKTFVDLIESSGINIFQRGREDGVWMMLHARVNLAGDVMLVVTAYNCGLAKYGREKVTQSLIDFFTNGPGRRCCVKSLYLRIPVDDHGGKRRNSDTYEHLTGTKTLIESFRGIKLSLGPLSHLTIDYSTLASLISALETLILPACEETLVIACEKHLGISLVLAKHFKAVYSINEGDSRRDDAIMSRDANTGMDHVKFINTRFCRSHMEPLFNRWPLKFNSVLMIIDPFVVPHGIPSQVSKMAVARQEVNRVICVIREFECGAKNLAELCHTAEGTAFVPVHAIPFIESPHTLDRALLVLLERVGCVRSEQSVEQKSKKNVSTPKQKDLKHSSPQEYSKPKKRRREASPSRDSFNKRRDMPQGEPMPQGGPMQGGPMMSGPSNFPNSQMMGPGFNPGNCMPFPMQGMMTPMGPQFPMNTNFPMPGPMAPQFFNNPGPTSLPGNDMSGGPHPDVAADPPVAFQEKVATLLSGLSSALLSGKAPANVPDDRDRLIERLEQRIKKLEDELRFAREWADSQPQRGDSLADSGSRRSSGLDPYVGDRSQTYEQSMRDRYVEPGRDVSEGKGGMSGRVPSDPYGRGGENISGRGGYDNREARDPYGGRGDIGGRALSDPYGRRGDVGKAPSDPNGGRGDIGGRAPNDPYGGRGVAVGRAPSDPYAVRGDVSGKVPSDPYGGRADIGGRAPSDPYGGRGDVEGKGSSDPYGGRRGISGGAPSDSHGGRGDVGGRAPSDPYGGRGDVGGRASSDPYGGRGDVGVREPSNPYGGQGDVGGRAPNDPYEGRGGIGGSAPSDPHGGRGDVGGRAPNDPYEGRGGIGGSAPSDPHGGRGDVSGRAPSSPYGGIGSISGSVPSDPHGGRGNMGDLYGRRGDMGGRAPSDPYGGRRDMDGRAPSDIGGMGRNGPIESFGRGGGMVVRPTGANAPYPDPSRPLERSPYVGSDGMRDGRPRDYSGSPVGGNAQYVDIRPVGPQQGHVPQGGLAEARPEEPGSGPHFPNKESEAVFATQPPRPSGVNQGSRGSRRQDGGMPWSRFPGNRTT